MARLTAYESRQILARAVGIPVGIECKSFQLFAKGQDAPVAVVELRLNDNETLQEIARVMRHIDPVVTAEAVK
jgi:hypothetical protein